MVAAAVFVAMAIALSQSLDAMIERISEKRGDLDGPGTRRAGRTRRRALARAYAYSLLSVTLTLLVLVASLFSMSQREDLVPRELCILLQVLSALAGVLQLFKSADA